MGYETLVHASPGFINSEHFAQFRLSLNFLCFFPLNLLYLLRAKTFTYIIKVQ